MSYTPRVTETATVYRSGVRRRFRWRLAAFENGEQIAASAQGRGYSRRIDALAALERTTGCKVSGVGPFGTVLTGMYTDGRPRRIAVDFAQVETR